MQLMDPNYPAWKFYLDLSRDLGTIGIAIYVWWSNREKVTSQRFAALEKEVAERAKISDLEPIKTDLDSRVKRGDLQTVKEQRDHQCAEHKERTKALDHAYDNLHIQVTRLPDRHEISKLDSSIKNLTEKLGNLDGRISGINRVADLMNQFLIEQGGKK